jgi:hypothetical protein
VKGLELRVYDLCFGVRGLGFGVQTAARSAHATRNSMNLGGG